MEQAVASSKSQLCLALVPVAKRAEVDPEVVEALRVLERALGRGEAMATTVRELWTEYAPWAQAHHRQFRNERNIWACQLEAAFGDRPAGTLTLGDVDAYRAQRERSRTRFGRPPAIQTVNLEVAFLRRLLNWSVERRLIPVNPIGRVKLVNPRNIRRTTLTPTQLEAILAVCHPLLQPALLALYDGGMRRMEVLGLRWDQINPTTGDVDLGCQDTKTAEPRVPRLSQRALEAILSLPRIGPWVFANPSTGRAYSPRYMYTWFEAAVKRAGIVGTNGEKITLHTLRHSMIKNWRLWGIADRVCMMQTGHRTRSAFDRYGLPNQREHAAAVVRSEAFLRRELQGTRRGPKPAKRKVNEQTGNELSTARQKKVRKV